MIEYGIGVLPLIQELRDAHPRVNQPWYTDDVGEGGNFGKILSHFKDLQVWGPPQGYFQETTNSILILSPRNVAKVEELFWGMVLKVVTGSLYIGCFIGD